MVRERPTNEAAAEPREEPGGGGIDWLGLRYQELSPGLRSAHSIPENVHGVWVRGVAPRSPLVEEGVEPGDLITEVNGQAIRSVAELESAVKSARSGSYLRLYVQRFDPRGGASSQLFAFVRVP